MQKIGQDDYMVFAGIIQLQVSVFERRVSIIEQAA